MTSIRAFLFLICLVAPLLANPPKLKQHYEYSGLAWKLLSQKQWNQLMEVTDACIEKYGKQALKQQEKLTALPKTKKEVNRAGALNSVGICTFVQGEAYRLQGQNDKAKQAYEKVISDYSYAQAWDKKGWYWQLSKAAKKKMSKLGDASSSPNQASTENQESTSAAPSGYVAKKYKSTFTPEELKLPGKKGICFALRDPSDRRVSTWGLPVTWDKSLPKVEELNAFWNYSWGSKLMDSQPKNIEFIPMIYGCYGLDKTENRLQGDVVPAIKSGKVKRLLGFNEPDKKNQANVSVKKAIEHWPLLEKMGVPLCSPSPARMEPGVNDGTSQGVKGKWLQDFFYEVDQRGLRVDYVGVHWYGGLNVEHFKEKMERLYRMYGERPLIITEFAPARWEAKSVAQNKTTPAQVLTFMKEILPWLEKTEWIAGYAWFSFGATQPAGWNAALLNQDLELTACGRYYRSITPNNPDGDLNIAPDGPNPPKAKNAPEAVSLSDADIEQRGLNPKFMNKSSKDLIGKSWKAKKKKQVSVMEDIWKAATAMYEKQALEQQAKLKALPGKEEAAQYSALNDLGLITFILAQTYDKAGEKDKARNLYELVKKKYSYAQAFEKKKGWWWSIAKGADKFIKKL